MGFRFRKSIKLAPGLKLNIGKKGISASVGRKGAHYTIGSSGKRTTSVGIPGTGLSYVSTKSSKAKGNKSKSSTSGTNSERKNGKNGGENQGMGTGKKILIGVGIVVALAAVGGIEDAVDGKDETATTTAIIETTTEEKTEDAFATIVTTTEAETTSKKETTTRAETTVKKETTTKKVATTAEAPTKEEKTVYITPTGTRYHCSAKCAGKNAIPISINDAIDKNYKPCGSCAE